MLKDLLIADRSCRGFSQDRRVTKEELTEFVDLTRYAPASLNIQPLKYYVVAEKEMVDQVFALTGWAKMRPEYNLPHEGKEPTGFVVICQDTAIDANTNRFLKDVGIVAHTMLLAATEKGLGGCMLGTFKAGSLSTLLNMPETIKPILVVAFGKPDEKIVLTEIPEDGDSRYYRDENDIHYVPKRSLEDILL